MGGAEIGRDVAEGGGASDFADGSSARRGDSLRPWGVFDLSKETIPWSVWEGGLGWAEEAA